MGQDILRRNNVNITGSGATTVIFAHGFGCDQTMWRLVAPAFADEYRVVLFDYVGLGRSDLAAYSEERYGSLNGYAQDVLDVCVALDLRDAVFVGHSVSSIIGILAAIRQPQRFGRLVLIGPSPRYVNDVDYVGGFERSDIEGLLELMDGNYLAWASYLAPIVMGNPQRPELAQELQQSFCSTDPRVARSFAKSTFMGDNRADLPRNTVPSLLLQCADDAIAPTVVGDYVRKHLPHSMLRQMQAVGHCPQLSHPEETIHLIKEYLADDGTS
mgnify:CR=1 FL=1